MSDHPEGWREHLSIALRDDRQLLDRFLHDLGLELHRRPPRHFPWEVILTVQGVSILLNPLEKTHMAVTLTIGHTLNMALGFLDQNGNPMLTTPVPDAAPAWTNTTPATETLSVPANGLTCVGTPIGPGSDTVDVTLAVGGVSFSASLLVTVTAAPQVLTSVVITPTVV